MIPFKKNQILQISAVFIVLIIFNACYYDKSEIVYPNANTTNCDTTNVRYSNQIMSILNSNCNNCHGAAVANSIGGGINLSTYTSIKPYVTNSSLLNSVLQNGKAAPMPKNASKLDDCSILAIQTWINLGALNN